MPLISDDAITINSIPMTDYASTASPTTPASGKSRVFTRGDGLYWIDDAGSVTGPMAESAGAPFDASGWTDAAETWTYASADDPTFTFTVAADVTTKYSVGMRLKLTQTTVKYFIITAVSAYSAPNTTITVYGGTDYDLANAAITSPYYSAMKAPFGFPMAPEKWTVKVTDTTARNQASPTQNVWYNLNSNAISIPIGVWNVDYSITVTCYKAAASYIWVYATLSTANNSQSDSEMSGGAGSVSTYITGSVTRMKQITLTSKTSYYLNIRTDQASISNIYEQNDLSALVIRAVCAYL